MAQAPESRERKRIYECNRCDCETWSAPHLTDLTVHGKLSVILVARLLLPLFLLCSSRFFGTMPFFPPGATTLPPRGGRTDHKHLRMLRWDALLRRMHAASRARCCCCSSINFQHRSALPACR